MQRHKPINRVLRPRKICEVREIVPFRKLVTIFPKRSVPLPKNMLNAASTKRPETVLENGELAALSKNVNVVLYNESLNRWRHMERHQQVFTEDEKRNTHDWPRETQIDDKIHRYWDTLLKMRRRFGKILESHLGQINITKQRIYLTPGQENPEPCVLPQAVQNAWEL